MTERLSLLTLWLMLETEQQKGHKTMARYRPITQTIVDGQEIQFDLVVNIAGEAVNVAKGSYLVTRDDGGQVILSREEFLSQYELVPTVGRKKKVVEEVQEEGQEA